MSVVLLLGSGPDVLRARTWPRDPFDQIVAINNAWAVRDDWDALVHPHDFPEDRMPPDLAGEIVTETDFVPAVNRWGGMAYAGGTMAFTAGYWALESLAPRVLAYMGCDMHYPQGAPTHFYGTGTPDPLRPDPTLQCLPAKAARLGVMAAQRGIAVVNLGRGPSQLVFPRATPDTLDSAAPLPHDSDATTRALAAEAELDARVPSGRYWEEEIDPQALAEIDALWLKAARIAA